METEKTLRDKCLGQNRENGSKAFSLRIFYMPDFNLRWKVIKRSKKSPLNVEASYFRDNNEIWKKVTNNVLTKNDGFAWCRETSFKNAMIL